MAHHSRPPIIAVVGHIDHGKSRLQRALRKLDTEIQEAGDITQHIGAYEIHTTYEGEKRRATVIDTPGHEAFSHIREHGVDLADIALLVISSEEGVKEQTKEAYDLLIQHKVPFIIVFTKIDTEKSNLEEAKMSALQAEIYLEGLGGSVPWIAVSSITGEGVQDLLDLTFLTTDVYEITDNREDGSIGVLVEVDIDRKVGIAGTVLLLHGTLEGKKYIRVGAHIAPLRILRNDKGGEIRSATPSSPVRVIGFDGIPPIGESVFIYNSKKEALEDTKTYTSKEKNSAITVEEDTSPVHTIPLIIRSDTASGLSSIEYAIQAATPPGIAFKLIKSSVGNVTEEDIRIALAEEKGFVVGFHTAVDSHAKQLAEKNPHILQLFPTIYEVTDWAKTLSEKEKESYEVINTTGKAKIIKIFEDGSVKSGNYILGAEITEGTFFQAQEVLVARNNTHIIRSPIQSLQQHSKDCAEVSGKKTQFAFKLQSKSPIHLNDQLLGIPSLV